MMQNKLCARRKDRRSSRQAERFRIWIEQVRRRQMYEDRNRRRRWLLLMISWAIQSKLAHLFLPFLTPPLFIFLANTKEDETDGQFPNAVCTLTDDGRRFLFDYAPRRGEEHLEVMDGLTQDDIDRARGKVRTSALHIEGMPARYTHEPILFATLIDHMASPYHRPEAFTALSLIAHPLAIDYIEKCRLEVEGLSWKSLRMCRRETHAASVAELARAAAVHEEMMLQEIDEEVQDIGSVDSKRCCAPTLPSAI